MGSHLRFSFPKLLLVLAASYQVSWAQQQPGQTTDPQATPAAQQSTTADQTTPQAQPVLPWQNQKKPPEDPPILEDGGLSIEPIYWLNRAQPLMRGGAAATAYGTLGYPGNARPSLGGEASIPAGRSNTLRLSYFRVQGHGNSTLTQDATIFSQAYNAGDFINASYNLQSAKLSWDFLSYTWYKPSGKIRFKTLYEVQFVTISTNLEAPLKPTTTDSSGNVNDNTANGSKNLIYPTLGVEFEEALGHHFRWEVKASGFDIPHRGNIYDAQADIAIRVGQVEILGGERVYHFKTSPQADEYFGDTLSGAWVGVRYYWGRPQ